MSIGKPATNLESAAKRPSIIQFPILDELSDEFSLLVSKIGRAVRGLDAESLLDLIVCIEEKLKAKGIPISLPSDAKELISILGNYWGFLNFELTKLVVQCLENEKLKNRMAAYEELVRSKVKTTLKECKNNKVLPSPPPNFETMSLRAEADPLSYSLHHILEMKEFLKHRVQLKEVIFAGWTVGSVILHFFIAKDDMETVEHKLKRFSEELLKLNVTSVEAEGRFTLHVSNDHEVSKQEQNLRK